MARHFGPIAVPKNIEPWLYNALNRLNASKNQNSAGLAAIARGETPDGSGNPLIPDLTDYFYKPGRQGGQLAYGAIESGGYLKLSSTAHSTKGLIYFGSALGTAYDETNNRFGIATTAPSAKLHVKGEPAGVNYVVPDGDRSINSWVNSDSTSATLYDYINDYPVSTGSVSGSVICNSSTPAYFDLSAITDPGVSYDALWVLKIDCQLSSGSSNVNASLCDTTGVSFTSSPAGVAGSTTRTTLSFALAAAHVAAARAYGFSNVCLKMGRSAAITLTIYDAWIEIPAGGSSAGADGFTALFDANASQSADNTRWRSSTGTVYLSVTSAGRLTVETSGSMRFVPGAGADKIMVSSNASGDLALVTVSGDVTQTGGVFTIGANKVTLAQMAQVATSRFLGRVTAGTGNVEAMTGTQATTLLDIFTTSLKGLVPSGGSNTTYLRGDATWQALTDSGWTDAGTVVRLNTSTDQVGIGTSSPSASLGIVNVNATSDVVLKVTGKASQSGSLISVLNSSSRNLFSVSPTGSIQLGNDTDAGNIIITIGPLAGALKSPIVWRDNLDALGVPVTTADYVGCLGARFYAYKSIDGQYDAAYGQGNDAWVMITDETIEYNFYTGVVPAGSASFLRCSWAGNGDHTNYGFIHVRKNLGAVTKGIPQLRLEETGSGTDYVSLRAPSAVAANRTQLLFDMNGTIPLVGDDPPAVASKAMGKVDSTGLAAAVASTNLTNSATAGYYLVQYYLEVTTADAGAVSVQLQINHTDDIGATNQTGAVLALTATGRDRGQFQVYIASGELSYQTNVVTIGTARYALRVRVIFLG